ncbi:MAG: SDR family NAD(P)-dependent oxidoreductase [Rhizobiaceae bacterium]
MTGRVAIVTGGLTGIGLASAAALQAAGIRIAVGSRRGANDPETADATRNVLGCDVWIGKLDVSDDQSISSFVKEVEERFGTPTILVNSHGIYHEAAIDGHSDNSWFEQIDINLNGVFRMIRAVFPGMVAKKHGRIVNISSTAAHVGASGYSAYCASKAGVNGLSRAVAVEGAPNNITCISISPTWIDTPMMERATLRHAKARGTTQEQAREKLHGSNPQGRLVQPEEIANLVAFCCSDAAPALTNEDIQVNAGAIW